MELSKFGIVSTIKNDFVFTLLITKDKQKLSKGSTALDILDIVTKHIGEEKPNIEVLKNEEDFLLLILKPKNN